jgi:hypothetical protein
MAAIVAVAGARVEQGVAAEQRRVIAMRAQADMAHGVARRVEAFELDRLADLDDIAGAKPAVDALDPVPRIGMRQELRAGGGDHRGIAAGVVAMLMRVENLRDAPALRLGGGEAFLMIERVDRQRFPRRRAGDEVVEVAIGIRRPDLFDDHGFALPASIGRV